MTTENNSTKSLQIILAIIAAVGGFFAGNAALPLIELVTGKTVPATKLEEVEKRLETARKNVADATTAADKANAASKAALAIADKKFAEANDTIARLQSELDNVNRIIEENNRSPQVVRISQGGSHLFAGTDLHLTLDMISGSGDELKATVGYRDKTFQVTPGAHGSATIVTGEGRNCDVAATAVEQNYGVFVVSCQATR